MNFYNKNTMQVQTEFVLNKMLGLTESRDQYLAGWFPIIMETAIFNPKTHIAEIESYKINENDKTARPVYKIREKTLEEKEAYKSDIAAKVREERNIRLNDSDYLLMSDYPISESSLLSVKEYRNALRNLPEQEGFPFEVVWPELKI